VEEGTPVLFEKGRVVLPWSSWGFFVSIVVMYRSDGGRKYEGWNMRVVRWGYGLRSGGTRY